jgi:hypothetical protein
MRDVVEQVERQLLAAIRASMAGERARRRRRVLALAAAAVLLLAVSGASAISGTGPIADVLGVERDDPTLRSVRELRDAPRAVVRVRADDGHLYTFAAFHASWRGGRRALCSTQVRDDARRIPSLGCTQPDWLARALRREGMLGGPTWGGAEAGSLRLTAAAHGFVPGDARRVTLSRGGGPAVEAELSDPIPYGLGSPTRPARVRTFLAVLSYDNDGAAWLGPPVRRTVTVTLADGTTRRQSTPEPQFFPMVDSSRPESDPFVMRHPGHVAPWRSVGYRGERGTLCTAAAPAGDRLIRAGMLQCSSPLALVNALTRYGAALYVSNFNPRRERGRRSVALFGFARGGARAIAFVDRRGRRYEARLSRPWTTVGRRPGDLAGLDGELLRRLERLPRRVRARSFIASADVPPVPLDAGLRMVVELSDGRILRSGPR